MPSKEYFYANGHRKTSTAKVRVFNKGTGKITVNEKPVEEYLKTSAQFQAVLAPLKAVGMDKTVDITIVVHGGGLMSQAGAMSHGIARSLTTMDMALRPVLKKGGFLTRDSRMKERKKPGLRRARRSPQWSKR